MLKSGETYASLLKSQIDAINPAYVSRQKVARDDIDLTRGEIFWDWSESLRDQSMQFSQQDFWYQNPRGEVELRAAYLRRTVDLRKKEDPLTTANVLICAGGKQAMFLAMHSLIRPGECVLLPKPGWSPYSIWALSLGAKVSFYDACDPEAADLITRIRAGNNQHLVVNSPNNPSGVELTSSAIQEITSEASHAGVSIVADEVYRHISHSEGSFLPFIGKGSAPVLVVDSMSKWLGAAGLRIGFLITETSIIDAALTVRGTIDSCPSGPSQAIANLMLSEAAEGTRAAIRTFARSRVQGFVDLLAVQNVTVTHAGGLYVWLPAAVPFLAWPALKGRVLRGVDGAAFGLAGYARFCPTAVEYDAALQIGLKV
ncbi:aminotransferase class I/II-fold pyridoxal phosphate-dependent enzyme [Rhizobium leguminosarum]